MSSNTSRKDFEFNNDFDNEISADNFNDVLDDDDFCCGNNLFTCAKINIGIDIALGIIPIIYLSMIMENHSWPIESTLTLYGSFVIYWACLYTEFIAIHKKIRALIIFNCVIRIITCALQVPTGTFILVVIAHQARGPEVDMGQFASIMIFLISVPIMLPYFVFRTWTLFKDLYTVKTLNNTTELQPLPPASNNII